MIQFILFLIIGTFGIILGYYLAVKNKSKRLNAYVARQVTEKKKRKQEILQLFVKKEEIANDDVEQALDVSDASATNYLEELEQEGKIIQKGRTGRGVTYVING